MNWKRPPPPELYSVPTGTPFVDAIAAGVLEKCRGNPAALSQWRILLPTRRACRSMAEAFLRQSGGRAALLPRLSPIGDVDEDELALSGWNDASPGGAPADTGYEADLPPTIPDLHRLLLLTRLIQTRGASQTSPDQSVRLAAELARLLDMVQTEQVPLTSLDQLVPDEFAEHWGQTLNFLEILTKNWPAILADAGCLDAATRRNLLLKNLADAWRDHPPAFPVIAAGSTGSIPATAALLDVIARMPGGAVVLPGLDKNLDKDTWAAIEKSPTHPQHGMARLLSRLEATPGDVKEWTAPGIDTGRGAARSRLINETLRPAEVAPARGDIPEQALAGARLIVCATMREEAGVIALIMRRTLDDSGRTAALITPDRHLARRVASALNRWNIEIDDSAGQPLATTKAGGFLRLCAHMVSSHFSPVPVLAVCKHPLATGGMTSTNFRAASRVLEHAVLRGPRPAPGLKGLKAAVAVSKYPRIGEAMAVLDALERATAPFAGLMAGGEDIAFADFLRAHIEMTEALAATDTIAGAENLWSGDDGETLARLVAELNDGASVLLPLPGRQYPGLIDEFLGSRVVRPRFGRHPRLHIWGLLEARLQQADVVILGGLNEGSWPPEAHANPWMSRPMLDQLGLPSPERRIGLTAHDFTQAIAAPEVFLTRSRRIAGAPSVPCRWLTRLQNRLEAAGIGTALESDEPWLAWHDALERPDEVRPAARPTPRPPVAARPRKLSVTKIETWIRDPYSIYAEKILKLRPLDPIDASPGAAERGTIIHIILDQFIRTHPDIDDDKATKNLIELGRQFFNDKMVWPGVRAFWWPRFVRIAHWFIDFERGRRADGHKPLLVECNGSLTIDGRDDPFILTARADRIDRRAGGGLDIIDYKTGLPPSWKMVKSGLTPQLPLQAAIAAAGGFEDQPDEPATALTYIRLSGGSVPGEAKYCPDDAAELMQNALDGLTRRVLEFDDPATPYLSRPIPKFIARFGDYDHLARVREWSAGGGEDDD